MRKTLLTTFLSMALIFAFGQITSEQTYSYSGTYTKLPVSGNKFYLMDVGLSQTRIYNTNHSLWKTISLSVPANNYLYDIKYLSEGLFTSDNTLSLAYIYYAYDAVNEIYTFNAKVIKENGTLLLTIPGCQYLDLIDLAGDGVKLLAFCYDYTVSPYTVQTRIYSLPGTLMSAESVIAPTGPGLPYPNPAIDYTTIPYRLPKGTHTASLSITDIQGKVVDRLMINSNADRITLPTGGYQTGMYNYSVESGNKRIETGKFLVK